MRQDKDITVFMVGIGMAMLVLLIFTFLVSARSADTSRLRADCVDRGHTPKECAELHP